MQASIGFDYDRHTLHDFVAEYHGCGSINPEDIRWPTEHLKAKSFNLNPHTSDYSVTDEAHGPFNDAFRFFAHMPMMSEVREPMLTKASQAWSKYVLDGAIDQSWNGGWTAHEMLHFYRQITPPEYQTTSNMKVLYAVIAAFDLLTTWTRFLDDALDGDADDEDKRAWYLHHPKSFPADSSLIISVGNRLLHYFIPESHPCKRDIIELYQDYMCYASSYLAITGARTQKSPNATLKEKTKYLIDDVTNDTIEVYHYMRSGDYVLILLHVCRLVACYKGILDTSDRRALYSDTIRRAIIVLQVVEDIRDTKNMGVEVPPRLSLNGYLEYVNDEMIKEFDSGEPNHAFLIASLEMGRDESSTVSLTEDEKEEIMGTLRDCYFPNEENLEDVDSNHRRLYRLCAMFLKFDVYRYVKEQVLPSTLAKYFLTHEQAVQQLNMPNDLLSYALGSMICQESNSRPNHVALEVKRVMEAPDEAINEKAKVLKMFKLLQNL